MLGQIPASGRVAPYPPYPSLTKHVSCLMCPIELQCPASCRDFRDDVSQGAEASGVVSSGLWGRQGRSGWGASCRVPRCLQTWPEVASAAHQAVSSPWP